MKNYRALKELFDNKSDFVELCGLHHEDFINVENIFIVSSRLKPMRIQEFVILNFDSQKKQCVSGKETGRNPIYFGRSRSQSSCAKRNVNIDSVFSVWFLL